MLQKSGKNSIQNMPKKNHRLDSVVIFPFYARHSKTFRTFYASIFFCFLFVLHTCKKNPAIPAGFITILRNCNPFPSDSDYMFRS